MQKATMEKKQQTEPVQSTAMNTKLQHYHSVDYYDSVKIDQQSFDYCERVNS